MIRKDPERECHCRIDEPDPATAPNAQPNPVSTEGTTASVIRRTRLRLAAPANGSADNDGMPSVTSRRWSGTHRVRSDPESRGEVRVVPDYLVSERLRISREPIRRPVSRSTSFHE